MSDTTLALLESVLSLVLAIGGAILLPKLRELAVKKIGESNTNMLFSWADTAVKTAEQQLGPGRGSVKYDIAYSILEGISRAQNLKVDEATLKAAIEAAVHELNQTRPLAPAAVGNVVVATPTPAPAGAAVQTQG